jgi:hypothetical protein
MVLHCSIQGEWNGTARYFRLPNFVTNGSLAIEQPGKWLVYLAANATLMPV